MQRLLRLAARFCSPVGKSDCTPLLFSVGLSFVMLPADFIAKLVSNVMLFGHCFFVYAALI